MSEPKALYQLCAEWRDARTSKTTFWTIGEYRAFDRAANELEAALRAWDAELDQDDGTTHLMTETVRKRVLGIKP